MLCLIDAHLHIGFLSEQEMAPDGSFTLALLRRKGFGNRALRQVLHYMVSQMQ